MQINKRIYRVLDGLGIGVFLFWAVLNLVAKQEISQAGFFLGKYQGMVVFEEEEYSVQCEKGTVYVIKIGNTASFIFTKPIPTISKVVFLPTKADHLLNLDAIETNYIQLSKKKLEILFTKGTKSWMVYADRN